MAQASAAKNPSAADTGHGSAQPKAQENRPSGCGNRNVQSPP